MSQFAELASGTARTEEDHVVAFVVIAFDEMRLPAASFGTSAASAFDTDELGGSHGLDDAATRRGEVAGAARPGGARGAAQRTPACRGRARMLARPQTRASREDAASSALA